MISSRFQMRGYAHQSSYTHVVTYIRVTEQPLSFNIRKLISNRHELLLVIVHDTNTVEEY